MPSRTLSPDLRPTAIKAAPARATPAKANPAKVALAQATGGPAHPSAPALARPAEPAGSTDLPGLRLITVPDPAPPYDCETHGGACPAHRDQSWADPAQPHPAQPHPAQPHPAQSDATQPDPSWADRSWTDSSWPDPSWADPYGADAAASSLADPHGLRARPAAARAESAAGAWPRQFAQVVVEILAGARSPRQILSCTTDHVREQISLLAPLVTAGQRPRIQRILTSHPTTHAVEMTVVVGFGSRSRALAVRCEQLPPQAAAPGRPGRPARWLCTELEAG